MVELCGLGSWLVPTVRTVRLHVGLDCAKAGVTISTYFVRMKTSRTRHKRSKNSMDQSFHFLFRSGSMALMDMVGCFRSVSTSVSGSVDASLPERIFARSCAPLLSGRVR